MNKKETGQQILQDAKALAEMMKSQMKDKVLESLAPQVKSLIDTHLEEAEDSYSDEGESLDETIDLNALLQEAEMEDGSEDEAEDSQEDASQDGEGMEGDDQGGETEDSLGQGDEKISDMTKGDLLGIIKQALGDLLGDEASTQDSTELPVDGGMEGGLDEEDDEMLEAILNEIKSKDSKGEDKEKEALMKENKQLREALAIYKQTIKESQLGQAQTKFLNKLMLEGKVDKTNVLKVSQKFEEMESVDEMERAYKLISESVLPKTPVQTKRPITQIKESLKNTNPAPTTQVLKEGMNGSKDSDFKARILKNLK